MAARPSYTPFSPTGIAANYIPGNNAANAAWINAYDQQYNQWQNTPQAGYTADTWKALMDSMTVNPASSGVLTEPTSGAMPTTGSPTPTSGAGGVPTSFPTLPTGRGPKTMQPIQAGSGVSYIPGAGFTTSYYPGTNVPVYSGGMQTSPTTGGTAGTSALPGGPVSNYNPAYGGIPSVPNPGGTQLDTLGNNLGALGTLGTLATGVGAASGAGAGANLGANLPGATSSLATGLGNVNQLLAGNIPDDVKKLLYQSAAERGVSMGSPGAPNTDASLLRSLGLTSLGLQGQGISQLGQLIGMTPQGPQFNPSSMLLDPNQQQMWQYLANMLKAAPIPGVAGAANLAALRNAISTGRGATGGDGTLGGVLGAAVPGSGALGFGFGTLGRTGTPSNVGTLSGPTQSPLGGNVIDPSEDPTQWMNPQEAGTWNAMSPDQQYEEMLMGYPSFTGDQSVTVPGSDTSGVMNYSPDYPTQDFSDPSSWDFSLYE